MTLSLLLFAAGLGTRMAPLTADRPKALIPVAGRPLLDHALAFTNIAPITRTVINLHYKGDMIREHLHGRDILFSDETAQLLETGGGLRKALPLLASNPVATMNTDAVWQGPNPLELLLSQWSDTMDGLLLTVPRGRALGHAGAGDFLRAADGRITRGKGEIYTGVQIIRTEALHDIAETRFSLNLLWDRLLAKGGLYGTSYPGQWCDVGQPASIPLAEAMIDV